MQALLKALQLHFDASSKLAARFPDGLVALRGFRDSALPNCVCRIENNSPAYSTGNDILSYYSVRITVYSDDGDFVIAAIKDLEAVFNECSLLIDDENIDFIRCYMTAKDIDVDDENVVQGNLQFEVWLQEQITAIAN